MMSTLFLTMAVVLGMAGSNLATLDDLVQAHPERVQGLFAQLDLERTALATVKASVEKEAWKDACEALLDYYRKSNTQEHLRRKLPAKSEQRYAPADPVLDGTITCYDQTAMVPRREDDGLDWFYNGPENDLEWGWGLNRFWWSTKLLQASQQTGNPIYAQTHDQFLRDWFLSVPYPDKKTRGPWRGLETFSRISRPLAQAFYGLMDSTDFTDVTRILLLASVPEHADYLRHHHASAGNWITMELRGLATAGIVFPEFKDAKTWVDYAMERMIPEMKQQVYPDGAQKELTSHYHRVTLNNFEEFLSLIEGAGREVSPEFRDGIINMWNYLAYTMRPNGYGILNNDSDYDHTRPSVTKAADRFNKSDWKYITSNGETGELPTGLPSLMFPWAGQLLMRNGWDTHAHWAFFDVGPLGIAHRHFDKLHLSIHACGRDLLVDSGRFTYKGGDWRNYFCNEYAHNVILFDGKRPLDRSNEVNKPLSEKDYAVTDTYDFARGTLEGKITEFKKNVSHTRSVLYIKNQCWIVVDKLKCGQPCNIKILWHYHPDCTVAVSTDTVTSTDADKGNLRIVPAQGSTWDITIVEGQEKPYIQGWYSHHYNHKEPASCVEYATTTQGDETYVWALIPALGKTPSPAVSFEEDETGYRIYVQDENSFAHTVHIPKKGNAVLIEK